MKRFTLLPMCLVLLAIFAGCVTSSKKMAMVAIGMSKPEVVQILGQPVSVSARADGSEVLRYQLSGRYAPPLNPNDRRFADGYSVQFADGKVVAYGRDDEFTALNVTLRK